MKKSAIWRPVVAGLGIGISLIGTAKTFGATIVWDAGGGADKKWSTAVNWVGDVIPVTGDTASLNGNSGTIAIYDSTVLAANQSVAQVTVGTGSGGFGNFSITGGTLTVDNAFIVGGNGPGTVNHSAGTLNVDAVTGRFRIANNALAGGSQYNLSGGALNIKNEWFIGLGSTVSGVVTGVSGTLLQTGGSLTNVSGVNPAELRLGNLAGATGTYTLQGGTATLGNIGIGYTTGSTGNLNLQGTTGGTLTANIIKKQVAGSTANFNFSKGTLNVADLQFAPTSWTGGTMNATLASATITNNGGTLSPGGNGTVGNTLFGSTFDYTQTSIGVLAIDIATLASFDTVTMNLTNGDAVLNGSLDINLLAGPAPFGSYDVLSASTISTTGLTLTGNSTGFTYAVVAGPGSSQILRLTAAAIPEPNAPVLGLMSGMLMVFGRRHGARHGT